MSMMSSRAAFVFMVGDGRFLRGFRGVESSSSCQVFQQGNVPRIGM